IAALSSLLFSLLTSLEYFMILPPIPVGKIGITLYKDGGYVLSVIIGRCIFFLGIAVISGYFIDKIKDQEKEIMRKEKELMEKEKMALAAHLAAESAHEIKNPLTVVKAGIYYLKMTFPKENEVVQETIHQIDDAIERITSFLNTLLNLYRPSSNLNKDSDKTE
ncbi:MAG: histidine kinase dimerization/phospho-acceptor domain-containing protein, partial [bacterium]